MTTKPVSATVETKPGAEELVIGTRRFAYDVWGDTVNITARIETASQPNRVLASAATVKGLGSDYSFDGPHKIDNKEDRVLEAFFVSRHP